LSFCFRSIRSNSIAQDNDFAKYFPASFGKSTTAKPKPKPEPKKVLADDGMDALRAFMPTSFGKQKTSRTNSSAQSHTTKREPDRSVDKVGEEDNEDDDEVLRIRSLFIAYLPRLNPLAYPTIACEIANWAQPS
jgi:hypothetical protein